MRVGYGIFVLLFLWSCVNAAPKHRRHHHKKQKAVATTESAEETQQTYTYPENTQYPSQTTAYNYPYKSPVPSVYPNQQAATLEASSYSYPESNARKSATSATREESKRKDVKVEKWKNHTIPYLKEFKKEIDQGQIRHHDYEEMTWFLKYFSEEYPEITRLYNLGSTVQNRKMWVMEISDQPGKHESGEPEMKYIGNIHGNEVVGKEILLQLIKHLCENYEKDDKVTELVDKTRIHILPSMNPDGYELASAHKKSENPDVTEDLIGRLNANGVDLNRNFPDQFFENNLETYEPETQGVINWIKKYPFTLSASFHSGAMVVTYPFDDSPSGQTAYSATPDDDLFRHIAKTYSENHPKMHLANPKMNCSRPMKRFTNGISNGAVWSPLAGGMQDYNYVRSNCYEVTVELGCHKFPTEKQLEEYWKDNQKPLLKFIEYSSKGVRGFVKDEHGNAIKGARITVGDRRHDVRTSDDGDFWRLLVPGTYDIEARAKGFTTNTKSIEVGTGDAAFINFTMSTKQTDPIEQALGHVSRAALLAHDLMYRYDGRDSGNSAPKDVIEKEEAQEQGREGTTDQQDSSINDQEGSGSGSLMDESVQTQKLAETLALSMKSNSKPAPVVSKREEVPKTAIDNTSMFKRTAISHPKKNKAKKSKASKKSKTPEDKQDKVVEKPVPSNKTTSPAVPEKTESPAVQTENKTDSGPAPVVLNATGIDPSIAKEVEEKIHVKPTMGMHLRCKVPGKGTPMDGQLKFLGHITNLPKRNNVIVAGLQLDQTEELGTDGTFLGKRYFTAPVKKGYFVPVKNCSPV